MRTSFFACLIFLLPVAAMAFNPPSDVQGPITATLEVPETITAVNQPVVVRLVLKNSGQTAIKGSARVSVIDHWRIAPADEQAIEIAPNSETAVPFTVTADDATCRALYPIHGHFEFANGDQKLVAHPIAIIRADVAAPARKEAAKAWRPITLTADSAIHLARAPLYKSGIEVFGEPAQILGINWQGSESRTRANVTVGSSPPLPDVRPALGIHPPWFEGHTGIAWMEYPLALSKTGPVALSFATAIRAHAPNEPPSDGVTFRVRVLPYDAPEGQLGDVVFEQHYAKPAWQDAQVDLSKYCGQKIRLQFESHPGPKNDTTCDMSYWGDPVITAGTPASVSLPEAKEVIGTSSMGGHPCEVRIGLGRRGLLDGVVAFVAGEKSLSCNGFSVVVDGTELAENGVAELVDIKKEIGAGLYVVRHHFREAGSEAPREFDLVIRLELKEGALQAKLTLENGPAPQPWDVVRIENVCLGPWSAHARQVYAGVGNVLRQPQAFHLGFDGHQLATSFVGFDFDNGMSMVEGVDVPPDKLEVTPEAKRYTLQAPLDQTIALIPCENVWNGVRIWRNMGKRPAAPAVNKLAGRFVFDLWGGHYGPSAEKLARAFKYGMTDSVVVWHNWQRWGYDYRLPDIYPPNPEFGTLDEFKNLADLCKQHDVLFAPHDNYIDFYPDAEGYSYDRIAFTRDGNPIMGWLNEGRKAQAYRFSTEGFRPFLEQNLQLIKDNTSATSYFIDVWSSIGPYDAWTRDGRLITRVQTRDAWGAAFDWIRKELGDAPQISESGHDQLIGHLDGAQCNHLRAGNPQPDAQWLAWNVKMEDGERIPWIDAAYHDRFVLHGAGYDYRYRGGLDAATHGIYSDDYICTEILTGHPAMIPEPFSRNAVRKYWLMHDLGRAMALSSIENVEFYLGDLHRQHVVWSNGETWVNRGEKDWEIEGHVLPQYGFWAQFKDASGAIERQNGGAIVEWSRGPGGSYVNSRGGEINVAGLQTNGACRIAFDKEMTVTPLPESPEMSVEISKAAISGNGKTPNVAAAMDENGTGSAPQPLAGDDQMRTLKCNPGIFAYRLSYK